MPDYAVTTWWSDYTHARVPFIFIKQAFRCVLEPPLTAGKTLIFATDSLCKSQFEPGL